MIHYGASGDDLYRPNLSRSRIAASAARSGSRCCHSEQFHDYAKPLHHASRPYRWLARRISSCLEFPESRCESSPPPEEVIYGTCFDPAFVDDGFLSGENVIRKQGKAMFHRSCPYGDLRELYCSAPRRRIISSLQPSLVTSSGVCPHSFGNVHMLIVGHRRVGYIILYVT